MLKLSEIPQIPAEKLSYAQSSLENFLNRKDIGFKDLPNRKSLFEDSLKYAEKFKSYKTLALVGIGGSSMGPESFWKILGPLSGKNLVIFDNVDALDFRRKFSGLNLTETAWFIVSKSGGTLETLLNTELVAEAYRGAGLNFYSHCIVCTENRSSPLKDWADAHSIPRLEIPLDVGGRFSVLTPVGLFPLAWGGVDVRALMAGAEKALLAQEIIAMTSARVFESFQKQNITVFFFYSSVAKTLGPWIQQLWAESLAKRLDRAGKIAGPASTPFFAVGSNDQHSILQQLVEGARDKLVLFFRSQELENDAHPIPLKEFKGFEYLSGKNYGRVIAAAAAGTEQALKDEGVATLSYSYTDHSAESMGFFIMWFELVVATLGEMMNINAFDQPGVEGSKKITKEILSR